MLRHVISPARCFAQIPNELLRNTNLSAQAVRLLCWQVSLPPNARESLSETAEHAGIKKTAFQRAKQELTTEGYLHEWRVRTKRGHWITVQLVSNTPLSVAEATAVRDGRLAAPGRVHLIGAQDPDRAPDPVPDRTAAPPAQAITTPSAGSGAVGEPTGRCGGRQPLVKTAENTSNPPAPPQAEPQTEAAAAPARHTEAETLLRSLAAVDCRLAMPARTARKWAPLAACWLEAGLRHDQIRHTLTQGLADARSPLGALRWRLEHAMPDVPPPAPAAPRAEPRLARMRECVGEHTQARLFVPPPGSDEKRCPDCRAAGGDKRATTEPPDPEPGGRGYDLFRAARQSVRASHRRPCPQPGAPLPA